MHRRLSSVTAEPFCCTCMFVAYLSAPDLFAPPSLGSLMISAHYIWRRIKNECPGFGNGASSIRMQQLDGYRPWYLQLALGLRGTALRSLSQASRYICNRLRFCAVHGFKLTRLLQQGAVIIIGTPNAYTLQQFSCITKLIPSCIAVQMCCKLFLYCLQ